MNKCYAVALVVFLGMSAATAKGAQAQDADVRDAEIVYPEGSFKITPGVGRESATLQRIIGEPNFELLRTFSKGERHRVASRAVGFAIILTQDQKLVTCTGFLLSPQIFMTNHHCIHGEKGKINVVKSRINFDYYDPTKMIKAWKQANHAFKTVIAKGEELDYALLKITPPAGEDRVTLKPDLRKKTIRGLDRVAIIQHPQGRPKTLVRQDTSIRKRTSRYVRYHADTQRGSSGSPVLSAANLNVVALHYRGVPNENGEFVSNEGSWMRSIFRDIGASTSSNDEALSGLLSRHDPGASADGSADGSQQGGDGMQAITE